MLPSKPSCVTKLAHRCLEQSSLIQLKRANQTCSWERFPGTCADAGISFLALCVEPFEVGTLHKKSIELTTHAGTHLQMALCISNKTLLIPTRGEGECLTIGTNTQELVDNIEANQKSGRVIPHCLASSANRGLHPAGREHGRRQSQLGAVHQLVEHSANQLIDEQLLFGVLAWCPPLAQMISIV